MLTIFREQPRPFYMIFMLELWERFGFYTVQGILILYLIRQLGYSDTEAYYAFGAFTALIYSMVILGGYLGDQILGTKRTIVLGMLVLIVAYLSLALSNKQTIYYALGLIAVGNGLFKANPSHLLAKCYEKNDPRLHGAFTLYYMAINIGSTFALILGPTVASRYGYFWGYLLSAIGLVMALLNYLWQRHLIVDINSTADKRLISTWQWLVFVLVIILLTGISAQLLKYIEVTKWFLILITSLAMLRYFLYMWYEKPIVRMGMFVALVLLIEAVIFFTLYQQMPSSINLFAVYNINPSLLGISFDPQSYQALNPFWIIVMSPFLAVLYKRLNTSSRKFTIAHKFAAGMTMCGFSFLILYFSRFYHDGQGIVSGWWLVLSYFFQSTGELLVSALGLAMVAELVPAPIIGFVMGVWFLSAALAGYIGGYVASLTTLPSNINIGIDSLQIYTGVFGEIGIVILIISLIMWLVAPWLGRFIREKD